MAQITYSNLMGEIEKLQSQANILHQQEVQSVIKNIQQQMKDYGLSPKDLDFGTGRGRKAASDQEQQVSSIDEQPRKSRGRKPSPKFRHPESGITWSGRGRMPKWISEAIQQGKTKEDFAIS